MDTKMRLFQNVTGFIEQLSNGFELRARMVFRSFPSYQEFDGGTKLTSYIGRLKSVGESFSSHPTTEGLIRNIAILRNRFLSFCLGSYQFINSFPKCNSKVFHNAKYRTKMRKCATKKIDKVSFMRNIEYRKFQK